MKLSVTNANRIICFLAYGYALSYQPGADPRAPLLARAAGPWRYMTIWNMTIHFFFYGACLLCELLPPMKRVKNHAMFGLIYYGLVFPLGLYVCIAFWCLYFYDPELVFSMRARQLIPAWHIHVSHTLILSGLLIEGFTVNRRLPRFGKGLTVLLTLTVVYFIKILYLGLSFNYWIYPFLKQLTLFKHILFSSLSLLILTLLYCYGHWLHTFVWVKQKARI